LYDKTKIKLPKNNTFPELAPKMANHSWGELRYYNNIPKKGKVPLKEAKKLIQGYYACISYVDAQIGKVLKELENLGMKENTIVVLLSDHGWSLSEHGLWAKHSNFEVALQIPLIISAPGIPQNKKTNSIAELVDVYPTLCDLTDTEAPSHLDGISLYTALINPSKIYKNTALARWQKGETLIAGTYFYTEWIKKGKTIDRMLYDHATDPNENRNLAVEKKYQKLSDSLSNVLKNKRITLNK